MGENICPVMVQVKTEPVERFEPQFNVYERDNSEYCCAAVKLEPVDDSEIEKDLSPVIQHQRGTGDYSEQAAFMSYSHAQIKTEPPDDFFDTPTKSGIESSNYRVGSMKIEREDTEMYEVNYNSFVDNEMENNIHTGCVDSPELRRILSQPCCTGSASHSNISEYRDPSLNWVSEFLEESDVSAWERQINESKIPVVDSTSLNPKQYDERAPNRSNVKASVVRSLLTAPLSAFPQHRKRKKSFNAFNYELPSQMPRNSSTGSSLTQSIDKSLNGHDNCPTVGDHINSTIKSLLETSSGTLSMNGAESTRSDQSDAMITTDDDKSHSEDTTRTRRTENPLMQMLLNGRTNIKRPSSQRALNSVSPGRVASPLTAVSHSCNSESAANKTSDNESSADKTACNNQSDADKTCKNKYAADKSSCSSGFTADKSSSSNKSAADKSSSNNGASSVIMSLLKAPLPLPLPAPVPAQWSGYDQRHSSARPDKPKPDQNSQHENQSKIRSLLTAPLPAPKQNNPTDKPVLMNLLTETRPPQPPSKLNLTLSSMFSKKLRSLLNTPPSRLIHPDDINDTSVKRISPRTKSESFQKFSGVNEDLNEHSNHDDEETMATYMCFECGDEFTSKPDLLVHKEKQHALSINPNSEKTGRVDSVAGERKDYNISEMDICDRFVVVERNSDSDSD